MLSFLKAAIPGYQVKIPKKNRTAKVAKKIPTQACKQLKIKLNGKHWKEFKVLHTERVKGCTMASAFADEPGVGIT